MEQVSYMEFRQHLSDYIGKARFAHERIVVTQRGKQVGAFVSIEDLETLQALEDKKDIDLFEHANQVGAFVDWDDVRQKLINKHGFTENELQDQA